MTNKVAKNASWIIGCKIVQSVVGFVLNLLTARFLGKSDFGSISYASAVVAFVVPIMRLGLSNIMVQEVVQNPEREYSKLLIDRVSSQYDQPRFFS